MTPGAISVSAKSRTDSRNSRCSSDSSKSNAVPPLAFPAPRLCGAVAFELLAFSGQRSAFSFQPSANTALELYRMGGIIVERRGLAYTGAMANPASSDAPFVFSDEVGAAFAAGRPVVALESTVIAHGLP